MERIEDLQVENKEDKQSESALGNAEDEEDPQPADFFVSENSGREY